MVHFSQKLVMTMPKVRTNRTAFYVSFDKHLTKKMVLLFSHLATKIKDNDYVPSTGNIILLMNVRTRLHNTLSMRAHLSLDLLRMRQTRDTHNILVHKIYTETFHVIVSDSLTQLNTRTFVK